MKKPRKALARPSFLNNVTVSALRRQFDLLDTDEDGHISPLHLTNILRSMDLNITDKEINDVMAKTDVDGKKAESGKAATAVVLRCKTQIRESKRNSYSFVSFSSIMTNENLTILAA